MLSHITNRAPLSESVKCRGRKSLDVGPNAKKQLESLVRFAKLNKRQQLDVANKGSGPNSQNMTTRHRMTKVRGDRQEGELKQMVSQ